MTRFALASVLVLLAAAQMASATFVLSGVITSNMVFQRDMANNVWGWGAPGTEVNATLGTLSPIKTTVAQNGTWIITFPVLGAGGPYNLKIEHTTGSVTLENIYIGEVFLCSGQSNMQFTVHQSFNASAEIAAAANYPLLRFYTTNQATSLTPVYNATGMGGGWLVAAPTTVGAGDWSYISAVCYYTGRRYYDFLASTGKPVAVGLVCSRWGGTIVQAWQSPEALAKCSSETKHAPARKPHHLSDPEKFRDEMELVRTGAPEPNTNSVLWNAMIVPLLNLRFRAAFWDQAEANVGQDTAYECWFPNLIASWRETFNLALPFFFVQLPGYGGASDPALAGMRIAQTAALKLPQTGFAVSYDLPDPTSPFGDIHPRNKETVAERLFLYFSAIVLNQNVVHQGPTLTEAKVAQVNGTTQSVTFSFLAGTASGLNASGVEFCTTCCTGWQVMWTVSADGKTFVPVNTVAFVGETVVVTVNGLASPITQATYAFLALPQCALRNQQGLPAPPFVANVTH